MRLTTKSPRIGALVFLPIVLAFGCARAPEPPAPTGMPTSLKDEQIVCVTLPDIMPGTRPLPSVDPVPLYRGKGHVAHWIFCGEGDLRITMKKDDPFATPLENGGKHVRSGKVRGDAEGKGKRYGYTITLTTKDGVFTNDPDIEIMD